MTETATTVLVTGASGFVGQRVVARLRDEGFRVRALVRPGPLRRVEPGDAVETVAGDVRDPDSLAEAARGCQAAVHLVGILRERAGQTYQAIHVEGTEHVLAACHGAGIRRLVHISALGVGRGIETGYFRSKASAEACVCASGLEWTILRPSVIHGPTGDFMIQMARMVARPGPVPVVGWGLQVLQPVWVEDVARLVALGLGRGETVGRTYEVGGPDILTLRAFYRKLARILLGRRKALLPVPTFVVRAGAWVLSHVLANPPVTPDELRMLEAARPCDIAAVEADFGLHPARFEGTLTQYADELKAAAGIG